MPVSGPRLANAVSLVAAGWAAGRAQTSAPDFELIVNAPMRCGSRRIGGWVKP